MLTKPTTFKSLPIALQFNPLPTYSTIVGVYSDTRFSHYPLPTHVCVGPLARSSSGCPVLLIVNNVAVPSTGSINNGKKQNGANHTKHQHGRLLIRIKHIPGKPLRHNGRRLHPARSSFDQPRQTCRISTTRHPGLKLVLVRFKKLSEF